MHLTHRISWQLLLNSLGLVGLAHVSGNGVDPRLVRIFFQFNGLTRDKLNEMDLFDDILKQASSNTKSASKEIRKIDEARERTKKCISERLAAERKQVKVSKLPVEKAKVFFNLIS